MPAAKLSLLTLSVITTAAIGESLAIGHDGAVAAAGALMFGLTDSDAESGDRVAVDVLGVGAAVAGAAIAEGVDLEVGTGGKLITQTSGVTVARSLQAAAADGDKLEVLLLP